VGDQTQINAQMTDADALDPIPNAIFFNWVTIFVLAFGNLVRVRVRLGLGLGLQLRLGLGLGFHPSPNPSPDLAEVEEVEAEG